MLDTFYNSEGRLVEKYEDENGRSVEDTHLHSAGGPVIQRRYPGTSQDEYIYFNHDFLEDGETPYKRCIYAHPHKLKLEQWLDGTLDKVSNETEYEYDDEYFVLGDNVRASEDSRFASVGNIDFDESYNQAIAAKQQALIKKLLSKALNGELGALRTLTGLIALHLKVSESEICELMDEDIDSVWEAFVDIAGKKEKVGPKELDAIVASTAQGLLECNDISADTLWASWRNFVPRVCKSQKMA